MNDPTSGHAGYWCDVRKIWDVAEVTPGLPVPSTCAERAVFNYSKITHAADAARSVARAETILTSELGITFVPVDITPIGSTVHYILRGYMDSGLAVDIVARAEHIAARDVPAPRTELAEAAA